MLTPLQIPEYQLVPVLWLLTKAGEFSEMVEGDIKQRVKFTRISKDSESFKLSIEEPDITSGVLRTLMAVLLHPAFVFSYRKPPNNKLKRVKKTC